MLFRKSKTHVKMELFYSQTCEQKPHGTTNVWPL